MKSKTILAVAAMIVAIGGAQTARAQDSGPLVTSMSLSPEMAHKLAMNGIAACRKAGIQVTVAVVDRGGNLQALLRDQFAGEFSVQLAINKARTAASFNADTKLVSESTQAGQSASGVRGMQEIVAVGGGYPIVAKGRTVGAVAVSGGPNGDLLAQCAKEALDEITIDLEM